MEKANGLIYAIMAIIVTVYMTLFLMICAEGAEVSTQIYSRNAQGDIYITETGWVTIGSSTYYVHETKSRMYDKNEACRNVYRWKAEKLYYFGDDGRMITKNTHYIKLNKDKSVKYIYTPGTGHRERYNVAHRRYQEKRKGRWKDVGNQTNLWWCSDWQL